MRIVIICICIYLYSFMNLEKMDIFVYVVVKSIFSNVVLMF